MTRHRTVELLCGVAAGGILVLGITHPAKAQITSAKLSTSQPSHAGPCPVTIPFSGSITGKSGTTFTISFLRIVNGVAHIVSGGTVTMQPSGTISVNDAITVSASTINGEVATDQILVQNISGGQKPLFSNQANFSVTCTISLGPPSPSPLVHRIVTLHPQWFGQRAYDYRWIGLPTSLPEFGTGPCPELCVGWFHFHQGDSAVLVHVITSVLCPRISFTV